MRSTSRRAFIAACLAVFLASPALAAASETPAAPGTTTVIRAGTLVDVEAGRVLESQTIVIEGETIRAVGDDVDVPSGAAVIDLSDAAVLPGLIDAHVHITNEANTDYYEARFRRSFVDSAVLAHLYARRTLEAGFTACRSVGSAG